jgi:Na+-driven multidrug efflux pump
VKWVTIASLGVFPPFACAVLAWHDLGITCIWAGLLAWITTRAWLNWLRFRGARWTVISVTPLANEQPSAADGA